MFLLEMKSLILTKSEHAAFIYQSYSALRDKVIDTMILVALDTPIARVTIPQRYLFMSFSRPSSTL